MSERIKALTLFSGGLDSVLAARILKCQNVDLLAVYFDTGFARSGRRNGMEAPNSIHRTAAAIDVPLQSIDIMYDYLSIVVNPRYGYGRNVNPCIDCKIMMLRKARDMMNDVGASFIATGEVLGQRPMSQHLPALNLIERESGLKGLLLRPLSAKLLKPTVPELNGWIERTKLCAFRGRSRKPQLKLAETLGVHIYSQPAGGCVLTDENYSRRICDLLHHTKKAEVTLAEVQLALIGRQFRISPHAKVVVGRNESDNSALEAFGENKWQVRAVDFEGPLTLADGHVSDDELIIAARITARYCDGKKEPQVLIIARRSGEERRLLVHPEDPALLEKIRI